jgi:hypothetical protein
MLGSIVDSSSFAVVTFVGCSFLNSAHPLKSTMQSFLWTQIYVTRGTTPCFFKGLENIDCVPLLRIHFVFMILVNYWKMVVPTKRQITGIKKKAVF